MSKANNDLLAELHAKLADTLKEAIEAPYYDQDGNKLPSAPAAILNVARQFLKDNGIDAAPRQGTPMGSLASLPVFGNDEGIPPRMN